MPPSVPITAGMPYFPATRGMGGEGATVDDATTRPSPGQLVTVDAAAGQIILIKTA